MTSTKQLETLSEDSFSDNDFSSNYSNDEASSCLSSDSEEAEYDGKLGYTCEPEYTKEELSHLGLLSSDKEESNDSSEDELDNSRMENLHWCKCTHCIVMPSIVECKCCHECANLLEDKLDAVVCVTVHEEFIRLCLDRIVLANAYVLYRRSKNKFKRLTHMTNKQYRFTAYSQFSAWSHHYESLGKHNRVVIPACVISRIRGEFPAQSNDDYTGFKEFIESQNG